MKKYIEHKMFGPAYCVWALVVTYAATLTLVLPAKQARAAESFVAVSKLVNENRDQVDKAIVYVGPRMGVFAFNRRIKEEDLPSIGCKYDLDRASVGPLIDIIVAGQLEESSTHSDDLNVRIGIYLYNRDGSETKLVVDDPFPNESMQGTYNGTLHIRAKPQFGESLRAFVGKIEPVVRRYQCEGDRIASDRQ